MGNRAFVGTAHTIILPSMNRQQLTSVQLATIHAEIERQAGYLTRLYKRMVDRGFPITDSLLIQVAQLREGMNRLERSLHLDYLHALDREKPRRQR